MYFNNLKINDLRYEVMNSIDLALQKNKLNFRSIFLSITVLLLLTSFAVNNEVQAVERISYSIDSAKKIKSTTATNSNSTQSIKTAPALIIDDEQLSTSNFTSSNRVNIADPNSSNSILLNSNASPFYIADAYVNYIHDTDADGFYHHFSVTFDPDISNGSATVYARMYISYQGGPWRYYYTTKTHDIFGLSSLDEITVETIFSTGYLPGEYDIRIDLFEVGIELPVASYGPYDDADLSYVFLEDEEHDIYSNAGYTDSYAVAGCSLNSNAAFDPIFPLLLLFSVIYFYRKYKIKNLIET